MALFVSASWFVRWAPFFNECPKGNNVILLESLDAVVRLEIRNAYIHFPDAKPTASSFKTTTLVC
jgi:hypothetical protein